MKCWIVSIVLFLFSVNGAFAEEADEGDIFAESEERAVQKYDLKKLPFGRIEPDIAKVAYSGGEKFKYDVSWTGGVKIGEFKLEIRKVLDEPDSYEIYAQATTDNGFFDFIYPIKDTHVTLVKGEERLPYHYEIRQKEGYSYKSHKVYTYDQKNGKITRRKNKGPEKEILVEGITYNEFSSFLISRVMELKIGKPFKVPTFASKKRSEIVIEAVHRKRLEGTVFGTVDTVEVMPILSFKGVNDKQGDTVVWYTDDDCRVPVQITSWVVLGSITTKRVSYENAGSKKYDSCTDDSKATNPAGSSSSE